MTAQPSDRVLDQPRPRNGVVAFVSRVRVPLGFLGGAAALWLAQPSWSSLGLGGAVALAGEAIRLWAAGHLEKGREVTKSGPYRWVGHPLYLGSAVIAIGIAVAGRSLPLAALAVAYLSLAFGAAIRNEEAELRAAFGRDYADYRAGRAVDVERRFSLRRALRNHEYRAVLGVLAGLTLFALKIQLML
jgi:protein-S-isoprenylcysteine O-methyltransferase Ste14